MEFHFSGAIFEWRGPAPHHFIALPDGASEAIHGGARQWASVMWVR
jgi:hypothetical protein